MNSSIPRLVITTSRRTSNRVRSFVRELCIVFPNVIRLTRGGLSLDEVLARARSVNAKAVLVVTIHKGNPGRIRFVTPDGKEQMVLFIESAALKREIYRGPKTRVHGLEGVYLQSSVSNNTRLVAGFIAALVDMRLKEVEKIPQLELEQNKVIFWFRDTEKNKTLWTCYQTKDGAEIGPRVRIRSIIME